MSKKTEELVEALSELTVLEMAELKTALEEKWGVKAAAAAVAVAAAPAAGVQLLQLLQSQLNSKSL